MKISVVTIVYNDVAHIEATLLNVIAQTAFNQIEYIVVDGASTDGTSDIIREYLGYIDTYVREKDSGIYNAMNKGLRAATGDFVIFINCGDRLSSSVTIENVLNAIGDSVYDVVYGSYREIQPDGSESSVIPCRNSRKIWYGPVSSHQSVFYRIEFLRNQNLLYDESYRIAADYKLTAQAIIKAQSILQLDICISDFDISGVSSTNQNRGLKEANRVRREVLGWGIVKICFITVVLLGARYMKKYANPIYNFLRHEHKSLV